MRYIIHNVRDSDWNITGTKYSVIVIDPSLPVPTKMRENESDHTNIIHREVVEAKYDIGFYHKSAVMDCFDWIIKDGIKRGSLNDIRIEVWNLENLN